MGPESDSTLIESQARAQKMNTHALSSGVVSEIPNFSETAMQMPPFAGANSNPEQRMHWLQVPFSEVLELYESQVLKVQRNHLRRAQSSQHLTDSDMPVHMNFTAGRTPDGKLKLVDGYTRIAKIVKGEKPAPDMVWLGLVDCTNDKEVEMLYDAMDSTDAVKRGRDAFEAGLRRAGLLDKLESPVFVRGQAVSAILAAAGHGDTRKATWELRRAIAVLDKLHIRSGRGGVPSGALAALLLLATHEGESGQVQRFAAALEHPEAVPAEAKKEQAGAIACAEQLQVRREQGALSGRNVVPIMEMVLGHWNWQMNRGSRGAIKPLSRDEYLRSKPKVSKKGGTHH
jgi:hypothetical protein